MAVKWSWVFGPETNTELEEMGWALSSVSTSDITQSSAHTYTYPGSPPRKSINIRRTRTLTAPAGTFGAEGWACVAFYCSDFFDEWSENYHALKIYSGAGGKSIKIYSDTAAPNQTMILQVDDTFDPAGSVTVSQDDWHFIALQYSMTGTTWSARWYLDGVPVGSLTTDASVDPTTDDQIQVSIAGCSTTDSLFTWYGQMIAYDEWGDDGFRQAYVTRVQPTDALGGTENVGTWNPVGAANNYEAVESPYETGSYSENSSASTGDKLFIAAGLGATIQGQTGVGVGSTVYGVTNHSWVTGSGLSGSVGIGKNDGFYSYSTGSSIFPDTNDPTYGYVTSGSFNITDAPTMVYEVE